MAVDMTLAQLLSEPILSSHHTHHELERFLLKRIRRFEMPDPNTWATEAEKLRQRVIEGVIFKGVPDAWRADTLTVEWSSVIDTDRGYRIRKLRYLALPGLWIPALLYEPADLSGKTPVVLNLNGHVGPPGKAIDYKQIRCVNLARRGMIALNPEWMNFGELQGTGYHHNRAAYLDLCGVAGVAVFYQAMRRGLEVLLAHEHADPDRVAVTGLSGGGWQTIILSALDTRVRLAAPNAGYIGLDVRVKHRDDIGDIEQNAADLAAIADYPMLTAMLAPRPALLIYNEKDDCCFQTERARPSVFEPVRPLYEALGCADAFAFHNNVDPGTHNYDLDNRQRFYRFINRHFLPQDARIDDEIPCHDEVRSGEELTVGIPEDNADFVSLAMTAAAALPRQTWPHGDPAAVRAWQTEAKHRLRDVLRYEPLEVTAGRHSGERTAGTRRVARYTLQLGEAWTIPALEITGSETPQGVMVVTSDKGGETVSPFVMDLLKQGWKVIVADILLHGACRTQAIPAHQFVMMASAAGSRLLGVQVAQLVAAARWAAGHTGQARIDLAGLGRVSSVVALMAAAMLGPVVERVYTTGLPCSLKTLIDRQIPYEDAPSLFCFGLLEAFDICELIGLLAPTPVDVVRPEADRAEADAHLASLRELYARFGVMGFQMYRED